jgi:hypothetical protein
MLSLRDVVEDHVAETVDLGSGEPCGILHRDSLFS